MKLISAKKARKLTETSLSKLRLADEQLLLTWIETGLTQKIFSAIEDGIFFIDIRVPYTKTMPFNKAVDFVRKRVPSDYSIVNVRYLEDTIRIFWK